MLYRKVYYDLSVCYEWSRWVDNLKIVNYAFMVILIFFWGMYFDILARMLIFWFIFWRISKRWSSNGHLWSTSRPTSWPPTFICRTLSDHGERWDFLLLGFKYLFWNDGKTVKASFSSLLDTKSIFAPQVKELTFPPNLC